MKLQNMVAIVTGSASGIGRAIALEMAKEGANIVVADINLEGAQQVAEEVKTLGKQALAIKVDVSRSQEVNVMAKTTLEKFAHIDILVNNAGGAARDRMTPFHQSIEETWDHVLGKNLKGMLNCSRAVINHMIERRAGTIISTASIAGLGWGIKGGIGAVDYSAAKGGILAATKALAREVAIYGIRVVTISPGVIGGTGMMRGISQEMRDKITAQTIPPIGRLGKADDIAHMAVFLASSEASFITGQNFIVDGGEY